MYYLLAILLGLIILPMLLLRLRPIRLPRVRGVFYGRAVYALTCAAVNFQELRKVFAVGVRKRESASAVIYPEWITECVTDSSAPLMPCLTSPYQKNGGGNTET